MAVRKLSRQGNGGLPCLRQASQKARIRFDVAAFMRALPSGVCLPLLICPPWPKHRGRGRPSSPTAHFLRHGRCTLLAHALQTGHA